VLLQLGVGYHLTKAWEIRAGLGNESRLSRAMSFLVPCFSCSRARKHELVIQSLMRLHAVLYGRNCLLYPKAILTPSHHPTATRVIPRIRITFSFPANPALCTPSLRTLGILCGVCNLVREAACATVCARLPYLSPWLSLAGIVGWDQSIVDKSTHIKSKRSLGPHITLIAFDGIPDDCDDKQATTSRRHYRET